VERQFGLPHGAIAEAAFEGELLRQAMTGAIEDGAWREAVDRVLLERHGVAGIGAEWTRQAGIGVVDPEMLELVDRLRGRLRVGLLSNATTRLEEDLAALDLAGHFDVVCNSARLGLAKPDEAVYRQAADLLGIAPSDCIFVDDTLPNVEAAAQVGMHAIPFTGVEALREDLDRLDVLRMPLAGARIGFRPLAETDFPVMHAWRNAPHVLRWWHDPLTPEEVAAKYLPRIRGEEPTRCFIIQVDNVPVGMIQTYRIGDYPDYAAHIPMPPDTVGIDIFIGREEYLHRGLGAGILRTFMETELFPSGVTHLSIDPSAENGAAIRAYEKAGFRHLVTVHMPDEPEPTYLMALVHPREGPGES
jgi:epoxide hydrolase-like predicted phosphatase